MSLGIQRVIHICIPSRAYLLRIFAISISWGDGEFVIALDNATDKEALEIARKLHAKIRKLSLDKAIHEVKIKRGKIAIVSFSEIME